jgi:hypothetical protein
MNLSIYAGASLGIYILEVVLAITIKDIGTVFGFIGTFASTSISYFIPSILFCKGY